MILSVSAADPTADPFTGCFGGGPGRLSDTTGVLTIDTATMQPGNTYVFKVVVAKDTRNADVELTVTLGPVAAPVVSIT